jgi:hypothetical protein
MVDAMNLDLNNQYQPQAFSWPSLLSGPKTKLGDPKAEIHMLVGQKQFWQGLLSLKSFFRFFQGVDLTIHSDGTLTEGQENAFRSQFASVRLISKRDADAEVELALQKFPACWQFRSRNVVMAQVFDFLILTRHEKLISLDSDILFLDVPSEVIRWSEEESTHSLYCFECLPYSPRIGRTYITQLSTHGFKFAPHFCGGFVCTFKRLLNLPLLEEYCRYVKEHCTDRQYRAQTMNALLLACTDYDLLPATYQNFESFTYDPSPVLRHYWLSNTAKPNWEYYFADAKRVLKELSGKQIWQQGPGIMTALRQLASLTRSYEFYGCSTDGWMAPDSVIRVLHPQNGLLNLRLEVPGWLPFVFPVCIQAVQNDRPIVVLKVAAPGYYELDVPLTRSGDIELSADQWFAPKDYGISSDRRRLSYRVLSSRTARG